MNLDELRICLGTVEDRPAVPSLEDAGATGAKEPLRGPVQNFEANHTARGNGEPPVNGHEPIQDKLAEIEMAARLGYLLCQCTWPPQIMVLGDDGQLFRCPRCRRRRDF